MPARVHTSNIQHTFTASDWLTLEPKSGTTHRGDVAVHVAVELQVPLLQPFVDRCLLDFDDVAGRVVELPGVGEHQAAASAHGGSSSKQGAGGSTAGMPAPAGSHAAKPSNRRGGQQ
jgi:hypothetical protein